MQISCGTGEKQTHWVSEQTGKSEAGLLGKGKSLPLFLRLHVNLTCSFLLASLIMLVAEGLCPAFCSHQDMGSITRLAPYSVPAPVQLCYNYLMIIVCFHTITALLSLLFQMPLLHDRFTKGEGSALPDPSTADEKNSVSQKLCSWARRIKHSFCHQNQDGGLCTDTMNGKTWVGGSWEASSSLQPHTKTMVFSLPGSCQASLPASPSHLEPGQEST